MANFLSSINPLVKKEQGKEVKEVRQCIICLNDEPKPITFGGSCKCKPVIHIKCMDLWLTKNNRTCPICRQKYPETDIQKKENEEKKLREEQESCGVCMMCFYIICIPLISILA